MSIEDVVKSPFAVGAVGAAVAALKATPGASVWEKSVNVISGAAMSGILTPPLTDYLRMDAESYRNGAAFMLGLLGMSLVAALLGAMKETKWGDVLSSWLSRR